VLSGDQLVSTLAIKFNAERIVVGIDEDGVFETDPKLEKTAKMFDHLTLDELKKLQSKLGKATACDVTGGMYGKMTELVPAVEQRIPVTVVNAKEPRNICRALQGAKVKGTLIEKE
jgi:isopentenyl phosphate kinase